MRICIGASGEPSVSISNSRSAASAVPSAATADFQSMFTPGQPWASLKSTVTDSSEDVAFTPPQTRVFGAGAKAVAPHPSTGVSAVIAATSAANPPPQEMSSDAIVFSGYGFSQRETQKPLRFRSLHPGQHSNDSGRGVEHLARSRSPKPPNDFAVKTAVVPSA